MHTISTSVDPDNLKAGSMYKANLATTNVFKMDSKYWKVKEMTRYQVLREDKYRNLTIISEGSTAVHQIIVIYTVQNLIDQLMRA